MSDQISITLPDGSARELPQGSTAGDLAASIGSRLAKAAVIAEVNGTERDLVWPLADGDRAAIVTETDERGLYTIRHSTAHVLAQAVLDLFPGATFAIGPPVENGFYYDFELPDGATFSDEDLDRVEERMRELITEAPAVRPRARSTRTTARKVFAHHPYKLRDHRRRVDRPDERDLARRPGPLLRERATRAAPAPTSFVGHDGFIDLCRGPHVLDTGTHLGHFKLLRVAGAYWKGSETNPQLQRIYGTAWATRAELDAHLHRLAEAAERDHRKLGAELDLFSFPDEIGSGLAVFHPKGGIVRRLMEDYSRTRHEQGGL